MQFERPLKSAVTLSFFRSKTNAMTNTNRFTGKSLLRGTPMNLHIREPTVDQFPKSASAGDTFTGTVTFRKKDGAGEGKGGKAGGGFPIVYTMADVKVSGGNSGSGSSSAPVSSMEGHIDALAVAVRDAKLKYLKGLSYDADKVSELSELLQSEYPTHLPLYQILLSHAMKRATAAVQTSSFPESVLDQLALSANRVISLVDSQALATEMGTLVDKENAKAVTQRKDYELQKTALVDALGSKAMGYLYRIQYLQTESAAVETGETPAAIIGDSSDVPETPSMSSSFSLLKETSGLFEATVGELCKWEDLSLDKHWQLLVGRHLLNNRCAEHAVGPRQILFLNVMVHSALVLIIVNPMFEKHM